MYLFGGTLTKLLAAVVAVMTAVSGLPRVQCVCPDGHVKLFCTGSSAPGCCCAAPDAGGGHQSTRKHACCLRATHGVPASPTGDGHAQATCACGCERTVVAATPQYLPDDDGRTTSGPAATALPPDLLASVPELPARLTHVGPHLHRHPPDLVVLHCHFTC